MDSWISGTAAHLDEQGAELYVLFFFSLLFFRFLDLYPYYSRVEGED